MPDLASRLFLLKSWGLLLNVRVLLSALVVSRVIVMRRGKTHIILL